MDSGTYASFDLIDTKGVSEIVVSLRTGLPTGEDAFELFVVREEGGFSRAGSQKTMDIYHGFFESGQRFGIVALPNLIGYQKLYIRNTSGNDSGVPIYVRVLGRIR